MVGRQRNVILATLLGLSAVGWIVFLVQAREPMDMEAGMGPDLTMGGSWPLFAGTWVAMMIAMMFPAAAPMVLLYARMRRHDPTSVVLFTAAYIALWFAFGHQLQEEVDRDQEAGPPRHLVRRRTSRRPRRRLAEQISAWGWRTQEPVTVHGETPALIPRRSSRASLGCASPAVRGGRDDEL